MKIAIFLVVGDSEFCRKVLIVEQDRFQESGPRQFLFGWIAEFFVTHVTLPGVCKLCDTIYTTSGYV